MTEALLRVQDLRVSFGAAHAVDGVSFHIQPREVLGLVGESGSGKTLASLAVLRLVPPPGRIAGGRIWFQGQDLAALAAPAMGALRGRRIAMVFQNPGHSLNPLQQVGTQLAEIVAHHESLGRRDARDRVAAMLRRVGLPDPAARMRQYPHEMSGGMKQRVCIARALLCDPALLLADEPTTALDMTVQAQILDLLAELKRAQSGAVLLVSHDLGVVARLADQITVMYAGRLCETGDSRTIFHRPRHPYTVALLESARPAAARGQLPVIGGQLPDMRDPPGGCRFHPRCPQALAECAVLRPQPVMVAPGHSVSCLRHGSPAL